MVLGKGNAKVKLFDVNGILQDVVLTTPFTSHRTAKIFFLSPQPSIKELA